MTDTGQSRQKLPKRRSIALPDRAYRPSMAERGERHDSEPIHPGDEFRLTGRFPGLSLSVSDARCI